MADILREVRFREVCNAVFRNEELVNSIITNVYQPVANYNLLKIRRDILLNGSRRFVIRGNFGVILRNIENIEYVGHGTYGRVYKDPLTTRIYKIIEVRVANQEHKFQEIIKECVVQIILQNILYLTNRGLVPCAPQIYGFYKYTSSRNGYTGFVIEMEGMVNKAEDRFDIFNLTFQRFLRIIKAIHDAGIIYNHCDPKLDNLMYDNAGNLRLIDFGFSSIQFTFTDTGTNFLINNRDCLWYDPVMVANPLHPAPLPPGYYIQKDVIHFLLTTWSGLEERMRDEQPDSYNFLIGILRYYGLSDGNVTLFDVQRPPNHNTFIWSYNFDTSMRRYLHNNHQDILERLEPTRILTEMLLWNQIKGAIENNNIADFRRSFDQLDNKNITYPGFDPVLKMIVDYGRHDFLVYALRNGADPNQNISETFPLPLIAYIIDKLQNYPNVHQFLLTLTIFGVNIDRPIGPGNMPILYNILLSNNAEKRNNGLRIILRYNPDLRWTINGLNIRQLAIQTGNQVTIQLIEEAVAKNPIAGGRYKKRKGYKTRQKKRVQKKQKKRQTRK